jgi:DNA-binding transcriptional MerR regulator
MLSIGELARRSGCSVPTVRYYEEIGLLPPGPRTQAGRRIYAEAAVRRLVLLRRCRDFGFTIAEVRDLVQVVDDPGRPCLELRDIAAARLLQLRAKLAELRALEASLDGFVRDCDRACAGGPAADCSMLEVLAQAPAAHAPPASAPPCCAAPRRADARGDNDVP